MFLAPTIFLTALALVNKYIFFEVKANTVKKIICVAQLVYIYSNILNNNVSIGNNIYVRINKKVKNIIIRA